MAFAYAGLKALISTWRFLSSELAVHPPLRLLLLLLLRAPLLRPLVILLLSLSLPLT